MPSGQCHSHLSESDTAHVTISLEVNVSVCNWEKDSIVRTAHVYMKSFRLIWNYLVVNTGMRRTMSEY
jgi:hypothetical protein